MRAYLNCHVMLATQERERERTIAYQTSMRQINNMGGRLELQCSVVYDLFGSSSSYAKEKSRLRGYVNVLRQYE